MRVLRKRTALVGAALMAGVFLVVTTGATAKKNASIQVCVLLPDTKSSVRWEQFDRPKLAKALKKAGVTDPINERAQRRAEAARSQADQCLANGAKVVIVTSLDAGLVDRNREGRRRRRAPSRSTTTARSSAGSPSVYVSFDGHAVGSAAGQGRRRRAEEGGHVRLQAGRRRAQRRLDGSERLLVQERLRRLTSSRTSRRGR